MSSAGRSAAQRERLARLSDDNAFVDVEATLKRIGGEGAWESSAGGGGGTFNATASPLIGLPSSSGGASTSGATAAAAGARGGHTRKGTRASETALLSGVRIPLTASLQDQHKAYLESVRAAAKEWEEASCNSSGSEASASDSADEDDTGIGGSGGVQAAEKRRGRPKTRRGDPQAKAISTEAPSSTSLPSPAFPSDLPAVKGARRRPVNSAAVARKRQRGADGAGRDTADAAAGGKTDSGLNLVKQNPCSSLVAKLTAELRLVRQWARIMLEYPPQIINGVLSPEPRAPWAQTTSTSRKSDTPPTSSEATYAGDDDTEVLPYPLLQVYSICPSYEALTAGPVRRREVVRCPATGDGWGHAERPRKSLAPTAPLPVEAAQRTVQVASFAFSMPPQVLSHRKRRGLRHHEGVGHAGVFASGVQVDFMDPGSVDAVQGERQHHLCSVCMLPAAYRCCRCRTALFCSIDCHVLHDATRCLKFTV
ncbi:hypothetical protein LSCM1_06605 [Leishmania martiniquensis]|uniref:HIT-type domain-containing protein n=1 Tax=Leishmania martiniquensis TaxID=1580590 RepID=A0A836HXR0_9TRYP|nr:hypothetical protein LSCM1_06605 [Leishmania martiniquensis]